MFGKNRDNDESQTLCMKQLKGNQKFLHRVHTIRQWQRSLRSQVHHRVEVLGPRLQGDKRDVEGTESESHEDVRH